MSGTNITILGAIVSNLLSGFSKRVSYLLTILIIIIFVAFVKPQAPIVRAGFMGILTLVANVTGSKTIPIYILLLSGILTAIFWPSWIPTLSFQLSYAATLGLILFSKKHKPSKETTIFGKVKNYVYEDFSTSLAAQVFTVPLIFIYFQQISLIAPFSNVLISWIIAPLMILGFLTSFLGSIHVALGIIPGYISYGMLTYVVLVIETLSKVPFAFIQF